MAQANKLKICESWNRNIQLSRPLKEQIIMVGGPIQSLFNIEHSWLGYVSILRNIDDKIGLLMTKPKESWAVN